jgi:hypothetical protein
MKVLIDQEVIQAVSRNEVSAGALGISQGIGGCEGNERSADLAFAAVDNAYPSGFLDLLFTLNISVSMECILN